jgi:hypothetical protein
MVQDDATGYLIFMFGTEDVSFEQTTLDQDNEEVTNTYNYNHGSEVWRARINQLWFDQAKPTGN